MDTNKTTTLNKQKILYAGDTTLDTAASYLAGIMTHAGLDFDYLPSDTPVAQAPASCAEYDLYIISDYPVNNITAEECKTIANSVKNGAGLIMLGGWESYHGLGGDWDTSTLAEILPVKISPTDDRVNSAQPCLIEKLCEHDILSDLPLDKPAGIGGYNLFEPKDDAQVILNGRHFEVTFKEGQYTFEKQHAIPLLVAGTYGQGRVCCLATDVAPHWVGGFVDWGTPRVTAQGQGAEAIEVGGDYAKFFTNLLTWTMRR